MPDVEGGWLSFSGEPLQVLGTWALAVFGCSCRCLIPLGEYSGSSLKSFIGFYAIHLSYFPCVVELFPLTVGRCPVFMTTSSLLIL